jgi:hypothetical protein
MTVHSVSSNADYAGIDSINEVSIFSFRKDRDAATPEIENRRDAPKLILFGRREKIFQLRRLIRPPIERSCTDFRGALRQ